MGRSLLPGLSLSCPVRGLGWCCPLSNTLVSCKKWQRPQEALLTGASCVPGPRGPQPYKAAISKRLVLLQGLSRNGAGLCTPAGPQGGHNHPSSASLPGPHPASPPAALWTSWERASGLACDSVWLYSVRRAIFSSPWLYFLLMTFWISAQARSKTPWGEDNSTVCLLLENHGCRPVGLSLVLRGQRVWVAQQVGLP